MKKYKNFYYNKKNPRCKDMKLSENGYPVYKDTGNSVHKSIAKIFLNNNEHLKKGLEVHHVDGDKLNYSPDNLVILSREDHWKISKRLHKERNLNKANLFVFSLLLFSFISINDYSKNLEIPNAIMLFLIFTGFAISLYRNVVDRIVRKTKLYKVISDEG